MDKNENVDRKGMMGRGGVNQRGQADEFGERGDLTVGLVIYR